MNLSGAGRDKQVMRKSLESVLKCTELITRHLEGEEKNARLKQMKENMLDLCTYEMELNNLQKCVEEIAKCKKKSAPPDSVYQLYKDLEKKKKPVDPSTHAMYLMLENKIKNSLNDDDNDVDLAITSQLLINTLDPFTKQQMVDPMLNTICKHVYEKSSVQSMLKHKRGIRCPVVGCPNPGFFTLANLEPDINMKLHIERQAKKNV